MHGQRKSAKLDLASRRLEFKLGSTMLEWLLYQVVGCPAGPEHQGATETRHFSTVIVVSAGSS